MRRLKAIEDENSGLKKIVADLTLDREMPQDVIRQNSEACPSLREIVAGMCVDWGVSIRRACRATQKLTMQKTIIVAGNACQTPEVRTIQSGTKITNFSLATFRPGLSEGRLPEPPEVG